MLFRFDEMQIVESAVLGVWVQVTVSLDLLSENLPQTFFRHSDELDVWGQSGLQKEKPRRHAWAVWFLFLAMRGNYTSVIVTRQGAQWLLDFFSKPVQIRYEVPARYDRCLVWEKDWLACG